MKTANFPLFPTLLRIPNKTVNLFHDITKIVILQLIIKSYLDQILFYGNERYHYDTNRKILLSTVTLSMDSKRFYLPLF